MANTMKKTNQYFQEALSDFTFDAASGRAIRHLVDAGFTAAQIAERLDYPTPFAKVRHTATIYLKEKGILLDELPISPACLKPILFGQGMEAPLFSRLSRCMQKNEAENAFISCPFGLPSGVKNFENKELLSVLTAREREYLDGIEWEPHMMYHRLNLRMLEIGVQLAAHSDMVEFYFFHSRELVKTVRQ